MNVHSIFPCSHKVTMTRRTTPPLALALALLAGCGAPQQPPQQPPKVGVVTLTEQSVELTTDLPGRVAASEISEVRPQIGGVIRRRLFTEGSLVKAGQVLYEIEDAPYRAALGKAQGDLARARAGIESTRLQADRYRDLVKINAVSRQDYDNALAAAQQAAADVAAQQSAVESARVNLGFTRIRAPISGRIGRSFYTRGALVQTGQDSPLATIMRTDTVYVDVTQSAAQILDLRDALASGGLSRENRDSGRVRLILPNGKTYPIEGRLQFAEISADPDTGSVTLRASFPNPDGLLLPGMFVRARLIEGVRQKAILAPQQGISRDPRGRATALVVNAGNKVELRQVKAERTVGDKWIIIDGLKAGDRLIVEGLVRLQPGTMVTPGTPQQVTVGKPAAAGKS